MANEINLVFEKLGNSLIKIITDQMTQQGFNATGETANSLRFEVTPKGLNLFGSQTFGALENGRKPGGFPPPGELLKWVRAKNIIFDGLTEDQTVFVIGRKIAKEGSAIFRGDRKGLNLTSIFQNQRTALVGSLEKATAKEVADEIREKI